MSLWVGSLGWARLGRPLDLQVSCSASSVRGNAKSCGKGVEKECEKNPREKDQGQWCHQSAMAPKVSAEGEEGSQGQSVGFDMD